MESDNVEIVRHMYAAFHGGNAQAAMALFDPDVVVDATRRPDGAAGRGREELAAIIGQWVAAFDDWQEEIEEIRDLGRDRVLVVATQRGRGRASGVDVETRYALLYTVREGKIAAMTLYPEVAEALEASSAPGG